MAGKSAILTVKILTDASAAGKGMDQASGKFAKFETGLKRATPYAAAAGLALAAFGKKAVSSASDAEQAQGAVNTVYGSAAKQVDQYAKTSIDRLGVTSAAYKNSAALMGGALQNAGMSAKQAAKTTDSLFTRSADLAAAYGGTTSEAMDAINAAISRGEYDPLERLNVSLSANAVNAELAARGQDNLTGSALKQAKAQATVDLIMKQSNKVAGQFASESDTVAVQQQKATASFEEASAALGSALLPAVSAVAGAFAGLANWVTQNATAATVLLGVVGGLAAGILALNVALKAYRATATAVAAVQKVMQAAALGTRIQLAALAVQQRVTAAATKVAAVAQRLFNAVMRANPVGLVITAIMLLVGAFVVLWNKNAAFRNFFISAWNGIKKAAMAVWNAIKTVVKVVIQAITIYVKAYAAVVKLVWKAIKAAAVAVWNAIKAVIRTVASWIKSAMRGVQSVVNAIWKSIKSAATSVWKGIRSVVSGVVNWIKSAMRGVKSVVNAIWSGIKSAASNAWNGIRTVIRGVSNWIKSTIRGVKTVVNGVWSAIKSAASTAFNPIRSIINGVKSAIEKVVGAAKSLIGWLGRIRMPKISFPKPPAWLSKLNPFKATYNPPAAGIAPAAAGGGMMMPFAAAGGPRLTASSSSGDGWNVVINVSGTLNDTDSARAVRRVLRNDSRRRGGVIIDRRRQEVRS